MDFMTTKEAVKKWNISERRIRQLLQDGRIEGAVKNGNSWNIPVDAVKPVDKRVIKAETINFIIDLDESYFDEVDKLKKELDSKRPIPKETLRSLEESINLEWTYNSNGIEGNTLSLHETQVVLEGITVGGKSIKEHLEAINHEKAILYLNELVKEDNPITEWNIKGIHQLVLKDIDDENAGRYRRENVTIKGATHIPPDYLKVPELMEKLVLNYENWNDFHPIIQAALLHGELVKIHPFIDGNGRTSRLLMNLDLMNHGFNPVIIKKGDRLEYYETLDKAHTTSDYTDFIKLITKLEIEILKKMEVFTKEVFEYYNGIINTISSKYMNLEITNYDCNINMNKNIFGYCKPNTITINLSKLIRFFMCSYDILYDYNSKLRYINIIKINILYIIIHELYHSDQIIDVNKYTIDNEYKNYIENQCNLFTYN